MLQRAACARALPLGSGGVLRLLRCSRLLAAVRPRGAAQSRSAFVTQPRQSARSALPPRATPQRHAASSSSGPQSRFSPQENEVLRALQKVTHPATDGQDVVFAGKIKDVRVQSGGVVSVSLELDEHYRTVKKEVEAAVRALPWVQSVRVSMDTPPRPTARGTAAAATASLQQGGGAPAAPTVRPGGLAHVGRVLAVSSCKGGVGKSTVAVNLAYSLAQLNLRVGIFDADVYGPSLPTMVSPRSTVLRETPAKLVTPPVYEGVKLMSYGFVLRNQAAAKGADADEQGAVMRGPMVSNLVRQLVTFTDWGELDYLVVDMPPGTGDVQITLTQQLDMAGAVVVTTPQKLARVDVVKGINMFDKVRVPIVAVVENMAYFDGDDGKRYHLFGPPSAKALAQRYGIARSYEVPIVPLASTRGDTGDPFVLDHTPASKPLRDIYAAMAADVHAELDRLAESHRDKATVEFRPEAHVVVFKLPGHEPFALAPALLRRSCQCALCVEEMTGRRVLRDADVRDTVTPTVIQTKGNYAIGMHFSDGHTSSIFPFSRLLELRDAEAAGGKGPRSSDTK